MYENIRQVLIYTFHPLWNYYVTPSALNKKAASLNRGQRILSPVTLFSLLDDLRERKVTGDSAIEYIWSFINEYPEYEHEIKLILGRNLECRIEAKLINSAVPKLIPEFNVALANKLQDFEHKVDFQKQRWYCSRKLDGLRMITIINNGDIRFFSREGKEFFTMGVLKRALADMDFGTNIVLDGEICITDAEGNEDFQSIMKLYNRKDFTIPNPKYKLFDCMSLDDFNNGYTEEDNHLSMRIEVLHHLFTPEDSNFEVLEQIKVTNKEHFEKLKFGSQMKNWEGLMIRRDCTYKGKRSNDLLKVKLFTDAEYEVQSVSIGDIRIIDRKTKLERVENMLSAVTISHKGFEVYVGSGFTISQRREFREDPRKIIGKVITVKYFEETLNEKGEISLRFPTFKCLHGDKREV